MNKSYWTGFLSGITVLSLGATALLLSSGFQGASMKIGNVDSQKVMVGIDTAKGLSESLKNAVSERENILAFLNANRLIKKDDIEKFRTLSLKTGKTDAEKAELEKIKASAVEAKKKFEDLQFKPSPNDADLKLLDDFRNRQTASQEIGEKIVREFQKEIEQVKADNEKLLYDAYKGSVAEVGKKQGFTMILEANIAPFSANDATEEVVKAATKK